MSEIISVIGDKIDECSILLGKGVIENAEEKWVIPAEKAKTIINNTMELSKNEYIIDIRRYATDKADEWFDREYENKLHPSELYDIDPSGTRTLKDRYNQIYMDKIDEIEEDLLHYVRDLNHVDYGTGTKKSTADSRSDTK